MRVISLAAPAAALALSGCMTVSQPRTVSLASLMPAPRDGAPRDPQLTVTVERFIDERSNRGVLGYAQSGFQGPIPISADGEIAEAIERLTVSALERKGVLKGRSPLALRGVVKQAGVNAMPMSQAYHAEVGLQLTVVNTSNRARLWARGYGGSGDGKDPQTALAMAFRDAFGALEADESILDLREAYLAGGGAAPSGSSAAAPVVQLRKSDVDEIDAKAAPRPDDFAIIMGIERYQSIPEAQFGERDANAFRGYAIKRLGVPEENVVLLTGSKASRAGLARYLEEWLPKNVGEKSRLWVYFSGHGAPDPVVGSAYIIPWDGDPAYLDSTAYPLAKLYERLAALKAKEIVVVLDTCFSGAGGRSVLAKGARPLVHVKNTAIPEDRRMTVLTASTADQIAGGLQDQSHGLFTYYFLKGLKGASDVDKDGHVTLSEMKGYLDAEVPKAARRQNREQTPQLRAADSELQLY